MPNAAALQELPVDRLVDFRRINELIGSKCRTGHAARRLAEQGLIRAVRINERVVRYSERSAFDLIAGKARA